MKTENLEKLAELIDRLDNLHHATQIPAPAAIHMEGLKPALPQMRDAAKKIFLDEGGEDHWA